MQYLPKLYSPQCILFTDYWKAYLKPGNDYFIAHGRVNHSKEFVNYKETVILPETEVDESVKIGNKVLPCHIQNMEATWGRCRYFMRKHRGAHPEYLQCWLEAFQFYDETFTVLKQITQDRDKILLYSTTQLIRFFHEHAYSFQVLDETF